MNAMFRQSVIALSLGLCAAVSVAQDFKIGFVNTDRIFRESAPAKAAQTKLEQEFSKREKELDDQGSQLKTAGDRFERESPTMAEGQRSARQKQLMDQDRDYRRRRTEFQEDLAQRKNEELQQVIERANRVIKQVAENEKYDLILQEAVYISPKHDITDKVLKVINTSK
ncbi:MAG TPA: OmpH family outer membrane protein [Burkholderiaceae bacterium]|nr:OmpH family outer membrane protein [Burkholderiaceae bacterium]